MRDVGQVGRGHVVGAGSRWRSVQDRDSEETRTGRDGLDVFRGGRANMLVEGAWQEVQRKTWDWT